MTNADLRGLTPNIRTDVELIRTWPDYLTYSGSEFRNALSRVLAFAESALSRLPADAGAVAPGDFWVSEQVHFMTGAWLWAGYGDTQKWADEAYAWAAKDPEGRRVRHVREVVAAPPSPPVATMTPAELADRVERGEKWQVATPPADDARDAARGG